MIASTISPRRILAIIALAVLPATISKAQTPATDASVTPKVENRYKSLETLARGMFYLETLYVDPDRVQNERLTTSALKGIVDQLDPHTMVLPKRAFDQLTDDTRGKFGGIGIIVSQEKNKLIVVSPIEDTPAYEAGVKPGDEVVAIDGTPLSQMKGSEPVDRMHGEPGSKIKLEIKRAGVSDTLSFTMVRRVINVKSVRAHQLSDGIVYARVTSFQENTSSELHDVLKKYGDKLKGLVLDLRDNPGGLLDQAVRISDLFIESGVIVSTVGRDPKRVEREFAHKRDTYSNFPIYMVVNGGSASASEIVAGALQDHDRAVILGTTTFGKGSVQTLVSLPDGSGLKLTVARYYTPKDRSIQAKGIQPDLFVPFKRLNGKDPGPEEQRSEKIHEKDLGSHLPGREEKEVPVKEAPLKIQDQSQVAKQNGIDDVAKAWPTNLRDDNQVLSAYAYLRGWAQYKK